MFWEKLSITNEIFINDKQLYLPIEFGTVLQACEKIGIQLPRFCYHDKLSIAGNCRMCLYETESSLKPCIACGYDLETNMNIYTESFLVRQVQEIILEFLLINHPLDCPICDQGGECDLQDLTFQYGSDTSKFFEPKRFVKEKNCGPFIKTSMNRCIQCTRCIRFMDEVAQIPSLITIGRGSSMEIGIYLEKLIFSDISGNLVDICPVVWIKQTKKIYHKHNKDKNRNQYYTQWIYISMLEKMNYISNYLISILNYTGITKTNTLIKNKIKYIQNVFMKASNKIHTWISIPQTIMVFAYAPPFVPYNYGVQNIPIVRTPIYPLLNYNTSKWYTGMDLSFFTGFGGFNIPRMPLTMLYPTRIPTPTRYIPHLPTTKLHTNNYTIIQNVGSTQVAKELHELVKGALEAIGKQTWKIITSTPGHVQSRKTIIHPYRHNNEMLYIDARGNPVYPHINRPELGDGRTNEQMGWHRPSDFVSKDKLDFYLTNISKNRVYAPVFDINHWSDSDWIEQHRQYPKKNSFEDICHCYFKAAIEKPADFIYAVTDIGIGPRKRWEFFVDSYYARHKEEFPVRPEYIRVEINNNVFKYMNLTEAQKEKYSIFFKKPTMQQIEYTPIVTDEDAMEIIPFDVIHHTTDWIY